MEECDTALDERAGVERLRLASATARDDRRNKIHSRIAAKQGETVSLPLRSGTTKRRAAYLPEGRVDPNPHVVVLLPDDPCRERLLRRLSNSRVTVLDQDRPLPKLLPVDVAVLHVSSLNLGSSPLLCDADFGLPEIVFVVDAAWSPQHLALRSRGFRHIVCQSELAEWFPGVMAELGALAQARRIVLSACDDGTPPPEVLATRQATGTRLHAAETSFREIFLRSLLAEHGSRRRAAEEAGVPYRSFCEMLRKLGIE